MVCDICKKEIDETASAWVTRAGSVVMVACEGCEFGAFAHPPPDQDAPRQTESTES